jgi:hypothetical protein
MLLLFVSCSNRQENTDTQLRKDPRLKQYVQTADDMMALRKQAFLGDPLWLKKIRDKAGTEKDKRARIKKQNALLGKIKNERGESLQSLTLKNLLIGAGLYRDYVKNGRVSKKNFSNILREQMEPVFLRYKNL